MGNIIPTRCRKWTRNIILTFALLLSIITIIVYLTVAVTLADPSELFRRYRGEAYLKPYFQVTSR